jgi:hypothetical protein
VIVKKDLGEYENPFDLQFCIKLFAKIVIFDRLTVPVC